MSSEAEILKNLLSDETALKEIAQSAFKEADADHNGFIDKNELKTVMQKLSTDNGLPSPSDDDVNEAYKQLDTNSDGKISPDEFLEFVRLLLTALSEALN